jgi:flagellar biosynthesis anti-sigma factor FlgM
MIISGKPTQGIIKTYAEQNKTARNCQIKNNNVTMKPDEVILSSKGQEFGHIYQTYKNVPEVRMDVVKEISERISQGEYNVAAKDVATKIMG